MTDARLTSKAQRVLAAIASGDLGPSPSNATIAEYTSTGERTVSRHLATLARIGYIAIERRAPNAHGPATDPVGRSIYITRAGNEAHAQML